MNPAAALLLLLLTAAAHADAPRFTVDPWWPKPLPERWITGRLGGVCVDGHDHVIVTNRRDITDEEAETSLQAPSVLIFDSAGALVESWSGDWDSRPGTIHGCFADRDNNIWITGHQDGVVQKYSHDGKLLLQIGQRGVVDSENGALDGKPRNASRTGFFKPAGVVVDPDNGDVYVADGYGNRRVAVFDRAGKFLRQWGRQATVEETRSGAPAVVRRSRALHRHERGGTAVRVRPARRSHPGLRQAGHFQRNVWIRTGTPELPDERGTVWAIDFSRDAGAAVSVRDERAQRAGARSSSATAAAGFSAPSAVPGISSATSLTATHSRSIRRAISTSPRPIRDAGFRNSR